MEQLPDRKLPPLSSSLVEPVGNLLQRRIERSTSSPLDAMESSPEGFLPAYANEDEEIGGSHESIQEVESARPSPSVLQESLRPRTYKLSELAELVRRGKSSNRPMVESGDPDGERKPIKNKFAAIASALAKVTGQSG